MEKMNRAMEKVKILVGMEVDDEPAQEESSFAFVDDFNRNCTLSTKQRLHGFVICLVAGITCTLLSMLVFFNPIKFGITFSFGNLLSLGRYVFRCLISLHFCQERIKVARAQRSHVFVA
ncbi:hypothetical protein RJ639_042619 [Escallonia herrerae]|uniref:Vesicle transport protein n=1 Tax=Escallonia herrerae TaxID=1293975 RepID=A0AA89B4M9_9ASTE|nr:hypothetical protein RJ639_042619 [Escallonia herrerae]